MIVGSIGSPQERRLQITIAIEQPSGTLTPLTPTDIKDLNERITEKFQRIFYLKPLLDNEDIAKLLGVHITQQIDLEKALGIQNGNIVLCVKSGSCNISLYCPSEWHRELVYKNREKIVTCVQSIVHDMMAGVEVAVKVEISDEQLERKKDRKCQYQTMI